MSSKLPFIFWSKITVTSTANHCILAVPVVIAWQIQNRSHHNYAMAGPGVDTSLYVPKEV